MTTLRQWFTKFMLATGEVPESVIFGEEEYSYVLDDWPPIPTGSVLGLDEVPDEVWDQEFDDWFGEIRSPNFCAWSKNYVVFSDDYDGAEGVCWLPRHPVVHVPTRPGGGG